MIMLIPGDLFKEHFAKASEAKPQSVHTVIRPEARLLMYYKTRGEMGSSTDIKISKFTQTRTSDGRESGF